MGEHGRQVELEVICSAVIHDELFRQVGAVRQRDRCSTQSTRSRPSAGALGSLRVRKGAVSTGSVSRDSGCQLRKG